jgi:hypothetical protein
VSNDPGESDAVGGRAYGAVGGQTSINIQGLSQATAQVAAFNSVMGSLQATMSKFTQNAASYASAFSKVTSAVSGQGGQTGSSGGIVSAMFGSGQQGWQRDLLMFPTRFMRGAITDNRNLALQASAGLAQQSFATGMGTTPMMGMLAGQFGNVMGGNPADLVNLMNIGSQVGAGINWNAQGPNAPGQWQGGGGPRMEGFLKSVFQAQRMTPGVDVGSLASMVGGQAANVGAAQQSMMMTGGAFSMVGAGNRQKSISEWADGILKWLSNLRPGGDRGKPFGYGELMAQNFPGSNIDAWLNANGVTPDMKSYFWSYAMAKSTSTGSSDKLFTDRAAVTESVAFNKLQASAAQTRTGFRLAGQMGGAYANKEQANTFFNELMGHLLNAALPNAMSSGALSYMQYMPDTMEEILMQLAERTNIGAGVAGVAGWGAGLGQLLGSGDVGDVGDYGPMGGTSTAGMHPDARKRVNAMMRDNPNIRMTSGFRDLGTQQRLKRKGVGRVSGKPSAHTRGMAADLGPPSQYGWISRNAKRYGLKSGISHGEPWHVGMGDIGDPGIGEGILDLLGSGGAGEAIKSLLGTQIGTTMKDLFGSFFGSMMGVSTPDEQIKAVGSGSSLLLQALMGVFAGGEVDRDRLAYRDVYGGLVNAANNASLAGGLATGVSTGGGWYGNLINRALSGGMAGAVAGGAGGGPEGLTGTGGAGTLQQFFSDVLRGMGAPVTPTNLAKLAAVAKIEGNNSGTFNPFNSTGGDFPNKFNSVGVENYPDWATGVEWTIKQLQKSASARPGGPEMAIARANLMNDGSYRDWQSSMGAFYTSWGGGHGAGMIGRTSESSASQMLTHQVGAGDVGDVGYYDSSPMSYAAPTSRPVIFQNTFKIDGGGASGGIDVRRTATLLADQLEQQMKTRMARTN